MRVSNLPVRLLADADSETLALYFHFYIPGITRSIFSCILFPSNLIKIPFHTSYCCVLAMGRMLKIRVSVDESIPMFELLQKLTPRPNPQVYKEFSKLAGFTKGSIKTDLWSKTILGASFTHNVVDVWLLFSKHHYILSQDLIRAAWLKTPSGSLDILTKA